LHRFAALIIAVVALLVAAQGAAAQDVVIDETRFHGPGGNKDNFIELRNRTLQPINLNENPDDPGAPWYFFLYTSQTDGFGDTDVGWYEVDIPEDVTIPVRGRVLLDDSSYSLSALKAADARPEWFGTDIAHNGGVELYKGDCDAAGANCVYTYQDGVGTTNNGAIYDPDVVPGPNNDASDPPNQHLGEGTLLPVISQEGFQWSFVRGSNGGNPVDTNNNAADFRLVGTLLTPGFTFGAPGPQNSADPTEGTTRVGTYLVDPTVAATAAPNRVVDATPVPNKIMKIRRMIRNDGSTTVTSLRYRIPNLTTDNSPGAGPSQAILRWQDTADSTLTGFTGKPYNNAPVEEVDVAKVTPQTEGGWNNASNFISLPGGSLIPGESFIVEFRFRVQQGGNYTMWFNAESAPNPAPAG
jgi:hypothetical protein